MRHVWINVALALNSDVDQLANLPNTDYVCLNNETSMYYFPIVSKYNNKNQNQYWTDYYTW